MRNSLRENHWPHGPPADWILPTASCPLQKLPTRRAETAGGCLLQRRKQVHVGDSSPASLHFCSLAPMRVAKSPLLGHQPGSWSFFCRSHLYFIVQIHFGPIENRLA